MNRPFSRRSRAAALALSWALLLIPSRLLAASGAYLSKAAGVVQLKRSGSADWDMVKDLPQDMQVSDSVRTGARAQATLMFADGSRIELGPNASFMLEDANAGKSSVKLNFGWLKAFVQKLGTRRFQVRTPTAVCSVRGTEFRVEVENGGRTTVDLYKGLLGVEDRRGQQVLLHPNERLQVDLRGISRSATTVPSHSQIEKSKFHAIMQREMTLDMSKAEVLASAAREIKLAEFQQGKALIDVFGNRVRLEEYVIRPQPNQFKLVVLNERKDSFNYFYYLGTFNTNLPADIRLALNQLGGTVGTAPTWWLTGFETGRSNTKDSIVELARGGHPVDVNHNADPADDVAFFFDATKNSFVNVAGQNVFLTLFDKYGFYINGGLKYGWTGSNIQSYNTDKTLASTNDPITGALLPVAVPAVHTVSTTFPDPNQIHQVIYESYSDGTFTKWDNFIIDDNGQIASPGSFTQSGATYQQRVLNFNYEQVITASEFQGRKIDLVVEPKILVQAGLLQ